MTRKPYAKTALASMTEQQVLDLNGKTRREMGAGGPRSWYMLGKIDENGLLDPNYEARKGARVEKAREASRQWDAEIAARDVCDFGE